MLVSFRGRFGQVHKCVENSSGLTLAAKVIKARGQKEKVQHLIPIYMISVGDMPHDIKSRVYLPEYIQTSLLQGQ